jgi:hypothetical protein
MPYKNKQKQKEWQSKDRKRRREAGYKLTWVKQTPPQYDTTISRTQFHPSANKMRKPQWKK